MDDLTGQRLDGYELLRQLGRGAMASVYLAEQASLGRRVAIKVLGAELCRDEAYVARFQHEARSAASLSHPGIVQIYEVGCASLDGVARHYIAQEYVAAGTLGRLLAREGAQSPGRVLSVMWQVTSALAAAAEQGIVHRDIKPENLMIDRSGAVKVTDFGLAWGAGANATRLTQAGVALGTPLYMSPEQIEGRELDSRSDLYSMGVTAYQLLTGEPPFSGDAPLAVAVQHLNQAPASISSLRPGVPTTLATTIERLLSKDPVDRYASPRELLGALRLIARQADEEGWADGSLDLASEGLLSSSLDRLGPDGKEAVEQLGSAMRQVSQAKKQASQRRRTLAKSLLVALLIGAGLAWLVRPTPLVTREAESPVQRAENIKTQLYQAKLLDTPAAWRAVTDYFPEADRFYQQLALRGYSLSLLRVDRNREAARVLEQLLSLDAEEGEFTEMANAGLTMAYHRLGRIEQARASRARYVTANSNRPTRSGNQSFTDLAPDLADELQRALREMDRFAS